MTRSFCFAAVLAGLFTLAGCKEQTVSVNPATQPATQPAGVKVGAHGDEHTGTKHELGTQTIGGYSVAAARFGDLKPGGESVVELGVTGGSGKPKAVRAWIGTEGGQDSAKAKGEAKDDDYDIHVEVPATIPADAKLWVEIETDAGKPKGSFDLKR
jgi:hypothetical protein